MLIVLKHAQCFQLATMLLLGTFHFFLSLPPRYNITNLFVRGVLTVMARVTNLLKWTENLLQFKYFFHFVNEQKKIAMFGALFLTPPHRIFKIVCA